MSEVEARFGSGSLQRTQVFRRLQRIHRLAEQTGNLRRFVVFGSFVTDNNYPNDVDVVMIFDDAFDATHCDTETRLLLDHAAADAHFGASVFWVRHPVAFGGEQAMIEHWQLTREGGVRGIVEIEGIEMIHSDQQFHATLTRIRWLQEQLALLRSAETNPENFRLSSSGFIAELDRLQLLVREYLMTHATEVHAGSA